MLENSCNARCGCSINDFSPVCSAFGTLFSPCYAGCQTQEFSLTGTALAYGNCSCIEPSSFAGPASEILEPG